MKLADDVGGSALFSECGAYRYTLSRIWDGSSTKALWIMLNPSTASADVDDRTVRRTQDFARQWGFGGVVIANLFALRSTDPKALYSHPDPVGPMNNRTLLELATRADVGAVVAAWGAHGKLHGRDRAVDDLLRGVAAVRLLCLGTTKDGHPRHPLYVAGATPLEPWSAP